MVEDRFSLVIDHFDVSHTFIMKINLKSKKNIMIFLIRNNFTTSRLFYQSSMSYSSVFAYDASWIELIVTSNEFAYESMYEAVCWYSLA